jgi:hypothetical protein
MHSTSLNMLYVFMQVLRIKRRNYNKNEYFYKHKLCYTIYLPLEQRLNPRNYFEQEKIMIIFVQAN